MKRILGYTVLAVVALAVALGATFMWATGGGLSSRVYQEGEVWTDEEHEPGEVDGEYVIVTYNVGYASGMTNNTANNASEDQYEANLQSIADAIASVAPDIVAMQEIDYGAARSYYRDQLEWLGDELGLRFRARAYNWDKRYLPFPYWPPSAHYGRMLSGQAVASAFPIRAHSKTTLPKPGENPAYYNAFYIDRLIHTVEIEIGERTLYVLNIHLEAFAQGTREEQAALVAEAAQAYDAKGPVILLGDFNAEPPWVDDGDSTIGTILDGTGFSKAIAKPAYAERPGAHATYPADNSDVNIDHIFHDADIEALEARVLQDAGRGSDHLPVMMRFRFANTAVLKKQQTGN